MPENVSTKTIRLKYRNMMVPILLHLSDGNVQKVEVFSGTTDQEKISFFKISEKINKLLSTGVRTKTRVLGELNKINNIDPSVFSFMRKVVNNCLSLS